MYFIVGSASPPTIFDGEKATLTLGIPKDEVKLASRSRKGYWRMAGNPSADGSPATRFCALYLGLGTARHLQILFASRSGISVCLGTASTLPTWGLAHSKCEPPSRFR